MHLFKREVSHFMKMRKLLASLMLIGLGATSCTPRNRVNGGICGGTTNSSTGSNAGNTQTGIGFDTKDPYSGVLTGLDTSKANKSFKGYVTEDPKVCYGWEDYTVESWHGAKYGVAVKLTFNDKGLIDDIEIGAPGEGYTNFSSQYGDGSIIKDGQRIYLTKYLASEKANILSVIKGRPAYELIKAFDGLKCDDSGSEGMDKWKVSNDSTFAFLGAGATQTDTRLQIAIYNACLAFVNNDFGYKTYDPFENGGKFLITDEAQVAEAKSKMLTGSNEVNTPVTANGFKVADGHFVGFAAYKSWGSPYGAGIEISVGADKKVNSVTLGYPYALDSDSKPWHNFTPSYIKSSALSYYNYVTETEKNVKAYLLGKEVNQTLLDGVNKATMSIGKDSKENLAGNQNFLDIKTGATQTNVRLNMAIAGALKEALK